jgi:hypothetical protein
MDKCFRATQPFLFLNQFFLDADPTEYHMVSIHVKLICNLKLKGFFFFLLFCFFKRKEVLSYLELLITL